MNIKLIIEKKKHLVEVRKNMPPKLRVFIYIVLLTVPVVIYCLPFILTGNRLAAGDADYLMQAQEASRIAILKYGQFPWWNPWVSGGVPLFANPQFGLYSIPSFFTLIFGSILGYKLALVFYFIMGFWGVYLLFNKAFSTPRQTALLLGYIWTFSSFFSSRIGGHYTFFTIQFFPIILLIFLKHKDIKANWIWLGLSIGAMINAASHNMTVMSLAVFALFVFLEICPALRMAS